MKQAMIDRYELLGKGLEKGAKSLEATVREGRDEGVSCTFRYKDEYTTKTITVFNKDGLGRDHAINKWCKANGKELVAETVAETKSK